uniref:Protein kinase domain-containing protein n=1 Tax=Panagrolaimus superbus TaxID=310955 RepID=A0A914XY92_9BILA
MKLNDCDSIGKQVAWADMSRELMSSARLLPSYPLKYKDKFPQDATKINRTKFLKKDSQLPIWWFNGNYSKDNCTFKFIVKEIDVSGIQGESVYSQTGDKRYEGNIKLMKELYILHFFKHDNLQHAFFTRSEPKIFRMNIILPRSIPLLTVSTALKVQYHWKKCPSMPYVAVCILRAVAYLHARDIVHGNISIENCSYDSNGNVLLGGLNNIDRCRLEDDMINDIWRVGTAVLDFVLETNDNGIDFPDYLCIEGYDSLDDKFLNIPSQPRNNNAFNRADDRFTCIRRGYIRSLISPDSDLMFFFDRVFRSPKLGSYPTAEYLLKYHHYSAIEQDTFQELQKALLAKCRRRELEAEPFCRDRQV